MARCPNCEQETEGNFCQWCGHPLKAKPVGEPQDGEPRKERHIMRYSFIALGIIVVGVIIAVLLANHAPTYYSPPSTPTPTAIQVPPNAPSSLSAEAVSQSQVDLHWVDNSNNEDGFRIYRDNHIVGTVGENITVCQDKGLKTGTIYKYRVEAYNIAGESEACFCTVKTLNPPITVKLDRVGVYDNRETWTRGEDGEVYLYVVVSDGRRLQKGCDSPHGRGNIIN